MNGSRGGLLRTEPGGPWRQYVMLFTRALGGLYNSCILDSFKLGVGGPRSFDRCERAALSVIGVFVDMRKSGVWAMAIGLKRVVDIPKTLPEDQYNFGVLDAQLIAETVFIPARDAQLIAITVFITARDAQLIAKIVFIAAKPFL